MGLLGVDVCEWVELEGCLVGLGGWDDGWIGKGGYGCWAWMVGHWWAWVEVDGWEGGGGGVGGAEPTHPTPTQSRTLLKINIFASNTSKAFCNMLVYKLNQNYGTLISGGSRISHRRGPTLQGAPMYDVVTFQNKNQFMSK